MSDIDLSALVDSSIGTPDGIINCNKLNDLLHLLVRNLQEIQGALTGDDASSDLEPDSNDQFQEQWTEMGETVKEHVEKMQCVEDQLKCLEERLQKCCEEGVTDTKERMEEQEKQVLESITNVEEQLKVNQEAMDDRLNCLKGQLCNLQKMFDDCGLDECSLAKLVESQHLVADLVKDLETMKAQMQQMVEQRDQMNEAVKKLVEEKDDLNKAMSLLSQEKAQMNALVDKLASQVGLSDKKEAAGTTHQLMTDLNCVSCDTDVVQRDRDDLSVATPAKVKPKRVIRKLSKPEAQARLRSKRAAGGSHTVVKPPERVFRPDSKDWCACSTSSSNHREGNA